MRRLTPGGGRGITVAMSSRVRGGALSLLAIPIVLAAAPAAADTGKTSIQFAPPPFPMTNLVVNDAVEGKGVDFMNLSGAGFNLSAFDFGQTSIDRYFPQGGLDLAMAYQLIYGTFDTSGGIGGGGSSNSFTLYGFGYEAPFTMYFDPLSKDSDDNSLPLYAGFGLGLNEMFGSMSFQTAVIDHYETIFGFTYPVYKQVTDTMTLAMLQFHVSWHLGIQAGLNLGDYIKVIPYLDVSQQLWTGSLTTISTLYTPAADSSTFNNLPLLPVTPSPGFDLVARKLGLSLGGAFQTMHQDAGDIRTINLHFRWTEKFRSICGL